MNDTKHWCNNNPKELVLIFHSELVHEAGYNVLSSQVYLETNADNDHANNNDGNNGNNNDGDEGNDYYDNANNIYNDAYDANNNEEADDDGGHQQQQYQYKYYSSGIAKLKEVYKELGIPYYLCEKLGGGLTVGDAIELGDLSKVDGAASSV